MTAPFSFLYPSSWPSSWPANWPSLAPYNLKQDILSDLSFISINTGNSSSPDMERRIVAQDSYGRQIGKMMDAVDILIAESKLQNPAFVEFLELKARVDAAKSAEKDERMKRLSEDLQTLKAQDPAAFKALLETVGNSV